MGIIETKYNAGDEVYAFGTDYIQKSIQCPDCLGTLKWTITFADGHSEESACYTCARGYEGSLGAIHYQEWVPSVKKVTIKNIRFGSEGSEYEIDEWCRDNYGHLHNSTRIYRDCNLFANEAEAEVAAQKEYEIRMAHLADNNFPKKGDFAKAMERSLYGYRRHEAITHTKLMEQWLDLIRPLQPYKKSLRQFEDNAKNKKRA